MSDNVAAIRSDRRLSLRDLSDRLAELGRPALATALSKIEQGARRVDVDDLVVLALALDVTPNRLLLTARADDERIDLAANASSTTRMAWRWATGEERPAGLPWGGETSRHLDLDRARRFRAENRPHDPPDDTPLEEVEEHQDVLADVLATVDAARERGLPLASIVSYVRLVDTMRGLAEKAGRKRGGKG